MSSQPTPVAGPRLSRAESRTRTRSNLVAAATALFAEQGVASTSIQQIADRAGYTRGAFHSNFESKADLEVEVEQQVITRLGARLGAVLAGEGSSRERFLGYSRTYLEFCADEPEAARAFISIVRNRVLSDGESYGERADRSAGELVQLFEQGQTSGDMTTFDTSVMATFVRAALDQTADRISSGIPAVDADLLIRETVATLDRATRS